MSGSRKALRLTSMPGRIERSLRAMALRAGIASPALLLTTSGSLTASMVLTSALGAAFWWVAARLYTPEAVGVAAGSISAMTFLGAIAVFGTGSLLLRELPRRPDDERILIGSAVAVAVTVGTALGVAYALLAPSLNSELRSLASSPQVVALFASGVVLTAGGTVVDHALLGTLRAPMQLLRNAVLAIAKLGLLVPAAALGAASGTAIYGVWIGGAILSFAVIGFLFRGRARFVVSIRLVRELAVPALTHFALNSALVLPTLIMPVLVALTAPPVVAAQFYVAWMLASVAFFAPVALAQSLYAIGGRAVDHLWQHVRTTLALAIGAGFVALLGSLLMAGPVLSLFGPLYREAALPVSVMVAIAVPLAVKDHFQIVSRIRGHAGIAAVLCGIGGVVEVAAAYVGLRAGGIIGLSIGWLAAVVLEAVVLGFMLYRMARLSTAT